MSYVYMKVLESAPERYDRGMSLLTLGRLARVQADIAAELRSGERVLDIGCGTGALAVSLAEKGCVVTGIDSSPAMLAQAAAKLQRGHGEPPVTWLEMGAVDLDTAFAAESFDAVVSTLVFSELSDDEREYTLAECWRLLAPGGRLLIADEVLPASVPGRVATWLLRLPMVVVTFVLTQNTTRRVTSLGAGINRAGFRLVGERRYLWGTLRLYEAEKRDVVQ
jgi:demethylmenaquinone methyltransferase/2-methoxy-6-polyprenyl-1,4-benzoquinol methylase